MLVVRGQAKPPTTGTSPTGLPARTVTLAADSSRQNRIFLTGRFAVAKLSRGGLASTEGPLRRPVRLLALRWAARGLGTALKRVEVRVRIPDRPWRLST
jgi:hypothetical protein